MSRREIFSYTIEPNQESDRYRGDIATSLALPSIGIRDS